MIIVEVVSCSFSITKPETELVPRPSRQNHRSFPPFSFFLSLDSRKGDFSNITCDNAFFHYPGDVPSEGKIFFITFCASLTEK